MRTILAVLCLLLPAVSWAQVSSTRETSADWYCCEDQACTVRTGHQRFDTALLACLNKTLADGKARWVQGGRYRITAFAGGPSAVTLRWTPPTENEDGTPVALAGYRIRYGTSPAALTGQATAPAGATSAIVSELASGTWYFAVSAYSASGTESEPATASTVVP